MNDYVKRNLLALCVGAFFIWVGTIFFGVGSDADKKIERHIIKEATYVAMKYHIRQKEDVIIYEHEFIENEQIIVFGYLRADPEQKRDVIVSYSKGFRVSSEMFESSSVLE